MKKRYIVVFVLLIIIAIIGGVFVYNNHQSINIEIVENLSLDNKNIKAYYRYINIDNKKEYVEIDINNEYFTDISKYNGNLLYDEETFLHIQSKYVKWLHPQYQKILDELKNTDFQKINELDGTDDLVFIVNNIDNDFTLYVYENNIIKIINAKIEGCYKSENNLTTCYDLFNDFDQQLSDFKDNYKNTYFPTN